MKMFSILLACCSFPLVSGLAEEPSALKKPDYVPESFYLACGKEEYERYRVILCSKAIEECETDWCRQHKKEWIEKFAACTSFGCEANPYAEEAKPALN